MHSNNHSYPTVATIIGCPDQLSSTEGLVATPIGMSGEIQPPQDADKVLPSPNTSNISDPVTKAVIANIYGQLPVKTPVEKLKCEVCQVECVGGVVLQTHMAGSKHAKRVKELEMRQTYEGVPYLETMSDGKMYRCVLCNTTMNGFTQISAHLEGIKHRNKVNAADAVKKLASEKNGDGATGDSLKPGHLKCEPCNVLLNSIHQYEQHMSSKRHLNRGKMTRGGVASVRPAPYTIRGGRHP